ncbi:MAG: DNA-directed DNA polymerase, partial [Thermoplasmata archaeon]
TVTVELFGKTRDGKSITVQYEGFRPYFYAVEPPKSLLKELKDYAEVVSIEPKELLYENKRTDCTKITLKSPWKTPEYREKCLKGGARAVLAADIPFHHRFIYDMDLASCVRVEGEEIGKNRTTDLVVRAKSFQEVEPFHPRLKILSFDIENSLRDGHLFVIGCTIRDDGELKQEVFTGDEKEMIRNFESFIRKEDPDVITGYNIDGYDIPVIEKRASELGVGPLRWSRNDYILRSIGNRFWRSQGRIIADAWWNVKTQLKPKQETLNHVAKLLLNEGKQEVDPAAIDEEWERDQEKVIKYCLKDSELALRILEKIEILNKSMDLATVSKLPVDEVLNGRTSTLIDSILIREADRNNIGVPMTKRKRTRESIEGGYVHSIKPGIHHWVCVLDFKAMYPSLIIENNVCFTTLDERGKTVSPIGVHFLDKEEQEGLLPKILRKLMMERDEIKKRMREAKTEEERKYYYGLQDAVKTLMNAFYGVFASAFYRFTNPKIGASIKGIIAKLEEEDIPVIYGDTDSIFLKSPYENLEQTIEFGRHAADRFSREGATLEFEQVLSSFFSHGRKKRYVGRAVWPKEETIVRGYEIRRTDAFDLQSEAQKAVFERILSDDINGAIRTARDIVTNVQKGRVPVEKLVISRTCKDPSSYVNPKSMANVQAAMKLQELGYEFIPGMKVSWIVTNGRKTPLEVEPYVSGREFKARPDWDYYARRVAHTLSYITDYFDWDKKSLLKGSQQATLFREDFGKRSKKKVRTTKKELTLEDFL